MTVAEVEGPAAALAIVDALALDRYHLWHATRAEVLRRCGDPGGAASAYERAIGLTANDGERRFLQRRHAALGAAG